jgi:tripartite-type tricarboxylate transporter receptor subunit TctC
MTGEKWEDAEMKFISRFIAVAAALFALASPSLAQSYPTRSITLVVPFAPGGPADVLGRLIGQKMSEDLGQQVVIDNRPGANTIIGAQAVAKARPDGYTLLLAIDGTLVMNPFLYSKLSYDPFKDFEPIALVADIPSVLEANVSVPVKTVQDVIDLAKKKPGELNVGVSTPTSQVTASLFNMMAGVDLTQVPYKGGTTQITGILAGDIQLGMESANVALPLWRDGKIKILGLTGGKRLSIAPEIPTVGETLPGFDLGIWQSVVAPAGTPKEIVARLYASLARVMANEEVRQKLLAVGIQPTISKSPEEFAAFIKTQAEVREKVIKAVGMKLD